MATMGVPWLRLLLWFIDSRSDATPNVLRQNSKMPPYAERLIKRFSASRMVRQAPNPIEKAKIGTG